MTFLTFRDEPDEAPTLTSSHGWIRRFSRLSSWRNNYEYWTKTECPYTKYMYINGRKFQESDVDEWFAKSAIYDARQRTSETAVYDARGRRGGAALRANVRLVELMGDLVREVVDATAAPMPLPAALEHRVLEFLDVREMSFVAAAGGLESRASRASLDRFFATHDFTAPLVARAHDFPYGEGHSMSSMPLREHHFGALETIRPPVATVSVPLLSNLKAVQKWRLVHQGCSGLLEYELRTSRWLARKRLRREASVIRKKLAEARATVARPDAEFDRYKTPERERRRARHLVTAYERQLSIAQCSIERFEGDIAASVARTAAAALAAEDDGYETPSDADSDYWDAREAVDDALSQQKRPLMGLLKALADGAFFHGVVEGSVHAFDQYRSVKGHYYREPEQDNNPYLYPPRTQPVMDGANETAVLVSLPVLDDALLHSRRRGATRAPGPIRATTPARVLFVVREVEGLGIDGDIANGSTGVYCDAVLHAPAWVAVKASAAEGPLASRLGQLPEALLGEVIAFAGGDARDGRQKPAEAMTWRWKDAEPDYLGPIEFVNLLSYTFGYHMAAGRGGQSLSLPSDAVAARVAGAMGVDPSQLGAVVRTVLLAANVRGNGIAHWEALESVHAFEGDPELCLGTGYFKYKETGSDERRREFRYPGNAPVEVFWPPRALTGGPAVAAYPRIYRPPGLEEDPEPRLFYNDNRSPKGVRGQLLLMLSRRLADPAVFSTLPRLVSALRGTLWKRFDELVEERLDILECNWGCSDARIDEIQAKARRDEIAGNIGSAAVENPAAYEHSLDYFWDFHGPNPYEPTGYTADY